jgi:membrane fusion protein, multidrug efflux system
MNKDDISSPTPASEAPPPANGKRNRILIVMIALLLGLGAAWGAYWGLYARFHQKTDDAYVAGNVIQVTPQVGGTVVAIHADDTDLVRAGSLLVTLDRTDAKVALDQAEAQLAQTVREVRTLFATHASLAAAASQRETDVAKARDDLARRQRLAGTGAVSGEELQHARSALQAAQAALQTAREQLASNNALIDSTTVEDHPNVARASAKVEEAFLSYQRAIIPAPVTGYVAKRSVQVGGRVAPGQALMSIVPLEQVWVDANFKEVQLRSMRIGQPVTLTADLYGGRISYHGKVAGMGAGTGSAFALLPAQNATGNWIKVVQRVPVRIVLDSGELAANPLRIGLSMAVDVDVADQSGTQLTKSLRTEAVAQTPVYDEQVTAARVRIKRIIAANLGAKSQQASQKTARG